MPGQVEAPHVLYVAWGYPPCRGGGVYRALATANAFAAAGARVTVLTATRETFIKYTGADTSLEALIDPRITVVRVPFDWPNLEADVRKWSLWRVLTPRLWRRARNKLDLRTFPELAYGPWRDPLVDAARGIHEQDPVDLVVGSANPNVDFAVGGDLHDLAGVPYVMDYRDAWMLDVFDGGLLHDEGSKVAELEQGLINNATEIWFVNEPIRRWHAERYPHARDRMHVVANGYDPELAPTPRLRAPDPDTPLTFGYIGTVSAKVPVEAFAQGWSIARRRSATLAGARAQIWGYLGFYSTPSPPLVKLISDHAEDGISYAGPLPKQRVREVYDTFDAALLILGSGVYVTSGKVFEYAASALPIVAVHDPRNAATEVLSDYPLWFPVNDLEPETIARAIEAAAEAARHAPADVREACYEFAARFARDLQLQPRVTSLLGAVGHSGDDAEATRGVEVTRGVDVEGAHR